MDLIQIADQGNTLETLMALRHKIAEALDNSHSGRDIAALARQLLYVSAKIAEIEAKEAADANDPIMKILRSREPRSVRNSRGQPLYDPDVDVDDPDLEEELPDLPL